MELSQSLGWDHYEVSSFCKKENYARHNKSYWEGIKYLGIGPSAHSYDQEKRYWNVSSNDSYLDLSRQNGDYRDFEVLTISDQINEKLLKLGGIVTEVSFGTTQKGTGYARFTMQDFTGSFQVGLYNEKFESYKFAL